MSEQTARDYKSLLTPTQWEQLAGAIFNVLSVMQLETQQNDSGEIDLSVIVGPVLHDILAQARREEREAACQEVWQYSGISDEASEEICKAIRQREGA